jgi:membrane-bound inhibitor of C-type lysozyme
VNGESHILERQRTASGARYAGDDIDFWNKGGESMLNVGGHLYTCSTI